ncbi:hypothetical protein O5286_29225, partial [Escherichia coli]|nr:hypothetical protein [Escherichia coli]
MINSPENMTTRSLLRVRRNAPAHTTQCNEGSKVANKRKYSGEKKDLTCARPFLLSINRVFPAECG